MSDLNAAEAKTKVSLEKRRKVSLARPESPIHEARSLIRAKDWKALADLAGDAAKIGALSDRSAANLGDALFESGRIEALTAAEAAGTLDRLCSRWDPESPRGAKRDALKAFDYSKLRKLSEGSIPRRAGAARVAERIRRGKFDLWSAYKADEPMLARLFPQALAEEPDPKGASPALADFLALQAAGVFVPPELMSIARRDAELSDRWDPSKCPPDETALGGFKARQGAIACALHESFSRDDPNLWGLMEDPKGSAEYGTSGLGSADSILLFQAWKCFDAAVESDPRFFVRERIYRREGSAEASSRRPLEDYFASKRSIREMARAVGKGGASGVEEMSARMSRLGSALFGQGPLLDEWSARIKEAKAAAQSGVPKLDEIGASLKKAAELARLLPDMEPIVCPSAREPEPEAKPSRRSPSPR